MSTHEYDTASRGAASPRTWSGDVVVVGAGTAGCYAAATVAEAGYDVVIVERKDAEEAGHIACGDALKGADAFPAVIPESKLEPAITNRTVDHGRFEIPQTGDVLEIPVPGKLAVVDRWQYGKQVIEGAEEAGVAFDYDVVVTDVLQDDDGTVTGIRGNSKGEVQEYHADVVIDGAGSLSILQDATDFSGTTFDTNVDYSQFCSAYREIVEVPEPVEWDDALVFKPTERAAGYLWYFPRTDTEINAGLGFQMTEEPMKLVEDLKQDLRDRPEFEGADVKDKLGAALPTRRPYDSAVAPGFVAAGDAAGHVNPTTGGGIAGAAYAGSYAGEAAIEAIEDGDVGERTLWEYNERVMDHFGARYAALDVYNIFTTAVEVDDLMNLLATLPGEKIAESLYSGSTDLGLLGKLSIAAKAVRSDPRLVWDFYRTKSLADDLLAHYESYPDDPGGFEAWQAERDSLMDDVYAVTGANPKY
jgi:geranylgeranyl reductase family protein